MDALARHLPVLASRIPHVRLGEWPTPVTELQLEDRTVWVKREGDSHPQYGGNKVRTLEVWLGHAIRRGARRVWAIGAYGSNHVIATVIHATRIGLPVGAILFPQVHSAWAVENARAIVASGSSIVPLHSVVELPLAAGWVAMRNRADMIMPPGGADTVGTFGAVSAAFELAEQIAGQLAPPPTRIVIAAGSACTTAGLLAGLALAKTAGAWRWRLPIIHAVRVTPWPVTARSRVLWLAQRTLLRAERLGGPSYDAASRLLAAHLVIDSSQLGDGYGRPTVAALHALRTIPDPRLDGVYSAKAAAALLHLRRRHTAPLMLWATKSTAVLPPPDPAQLRHAPRVLARFLEPSTNDVLLHSGRASLVPRTGGF